MFGENGKPIDIYQTRTFEKTFKRLSEQQKDLVEDEIDLIIKDPEIGVQKKGDLSHIWVHKFTLNNQQVLLGYSWLAGKLELYLLNIGPHENFYKDAKKRRDADLKFIDE